MTYPDYYRFKRYIPIQADSFEEAKSKLLEMVLSKHKKEIENLILTTEEKDRWSKCGCTGWNCEPDCPKYEIPF